MKPIALTLALCGSLLITGCACKNLISSEDLPFITAKMPELAAITKTEATVRIDSERFRDEFTGVLLVRKQPLAIRLQMFPDIGGKMMDLAATADKQEGMLPATGAKLEASTGEGATTNSTENDPLLGMFATTLLQLNTPLAAADFLCSQRTGMHTHRFELRPRYGASSCLLETNRGVRTYTLTRDGVSWTAIASLDGKVEIQAPGFSLEVTPKDTTHPTELPTGVFQLQR